MHIRNIALTVLATALLASCASQQPVSSIEFNYKVENANAAGIVQVFDMTGNTVVQIRDLDSKPPLFFDAKQREIKYSVVGQTAVLAGYHPSFTVVSGMTSSKVTRVNGALAVASTAVPQPAAPQQVESATAAAVTDTSDAEMLAQLKAMKAELATLKQMLAANGSPSREPNKNAGQRYAVVASSKSVNSLRVQFKDNSSEFDPKPATASTLIDLAKDASEISITGYTDSSKSTPASVRLAKERAAAASRFLVSRGVEKNKIVTNFQPAGGFVAENNSKEGRDQNRRVEISML